MQISASQNWYKRSNLSIVVEHLFLQCRIVRTSVLMRQVREKEERDRTGGEQLKGFK